MLLGSHLSTAGGLHLALESARDYGFAAVALFVRSPRQWKAPPLTPDKVRAFKSTRRACGIRCVVAHANYLFNLAGEPAIRKKSIAGLSDELQRCAELGIEYLVLHPGSNPDTDKGIQLIANGLDQAIATTVRKKVKLLVEGMAGQGNTIGHRFEHLAGILGKVSNPRRFGVCLDTCHMFAAGYDIRTPKTWKTTIHEFDKVVGLEHLHALHCNDSLKPFASRRDRHQHIGEGAIGLKGFANVVKDKRLKDLPFIMETPKGERESDGKDWDDINAGVLRRLAKK